MDKQNLSSFFNGLFSGPGFPAAMSRAHQFSLPRTPGSAGGVCDPSCFPLSLLNHFFPSNWQRNIRQKTYFPLRPCALQTPCFLLFRCLPAALTLSQVSEGWSPGLPSFSLSPTRLLCWGILVAAWMTHPATWPLSSLTSLSFLSWPFYPRLPV